MVGDEFYFEVLVAMTVWALMSGAAIATSVTQASKRFAWGGVASFLLSALAAAYCFGRLL